MLYLHIIDHQRFHTNLHAREDASRSVTVVSLNSLPSAQVGEVTGIMKQNIEKVLERGERLDDLVDKTEDLQASVSFRGLNKAS